MTHSAFEDARIVVPIEALDLVEKARARTPAGRLPTEIEIVDTRAFIPCSTCAGSGTVHPCITCRVCGGWGSR